MSAHYQSIYFEMKINKAFNSGLMRNFEDAHIFYRTLHGFSLSVLVFFLVLISYCLGQTYNIHWTTVKSVYHVYISLYNFATEMCVVIFVCVFENRFQRVANVKWDERSVGWKLGGARANLCFRWKDSGWRDSRKRFQVIYI